MKPYFAKHCSPSCGDQCEANGVATDANHGEAIREDSQSFLCSVPYVEKFWYEKELANLANRVLFTKVIHTYYFFVIGCTYTHSSFANNLPSNWFGLAYLPVFSHMVLMSLWLAEFWGCFVCFFHSIKLYTTFWSLSLYDLHVPVSGYDEEISKLEQNIKSLDDNTDMVSGWMYSYIHAWIWAVE